jgi:hypothetical protein
MRIMILAAMAAAFIAALGASAAEAGSRYCLKRSPGPGDCKYSSYRQCQASASGVGGTCERSPFRRRR